MKLGFCYFRDSFASRLKGERSTLYVDSASSNPFIMRAEKLFFGNAVTYTLSTRKTKKHSIQTCENLKIIKKPFASPVLSGIVELLIVGSNQLRSAGAGRFLVYPLLGEALENKQLPTLRHANLVGVWVDTLSPRLQCLNRRLIVRKLADGELVGTAISIDLVGKAGDNGVR